MNTKIVPLLMAALLTAHEASAQESKGWRDKLGDAAGNIGRVIESKTADATDYVAGQALKAKLGTQIEERVPYEHGTPNLDTFLSSYGKPSKDAVVTSLDQREGQVHATVTTRLPYEGFSLARPYVFSIGRENNLEQEVQRGEVTGTIHGSAVDYDKFVRVLSLDQIATERWNTEKQTYEAGHPTLQVSFKVASRSYEGNIYQSNQERLSSHGLDRTYDGLVVIDYCITDSTGNPTGCFRVEEGYDLTWGLAGKHWEFENRMSKMDIPPPRDIGRTLRQGAKKVGEGTTEMYERAKEAIQERR
ncbi:hypothetical protein HYW21_06645 [Candidatus Woesearchaeota archaeon]|nr:hypothetical protein [Candidatus Woesearchaeota archaeon]